MNETVIKLFRPMVTPQDAAVQLDFVPPLQRRRLSKLQQRYFAMAHAITHDQPQDYRVVFASQDGEDALTKKLVAAFNEEHDVSPMRFSTSVYNAAPGLYSIFTKNKASYSAIAGESETLDCSLLEALIADEPTLWVYAEETNQTPTVGAFILPAEAAAPDGAWVCQLKAGDPNAADVTTDRLSAFFAGETDSLVSRYFTLVRV